MNVAVGLEAIGRPVNASNTMPPAAGLSFNYATDNGNGLTPSPGALNAGQTSSL